MTERYCELGSKISPVMRECLIGTFERNIHTFLSVDLNTVIMSLFELYTIVVVKRNIDVLYEAGFRLSWAIDSDSRE